jgi:glycosyltransferase involved in cell wall biosynthesis
MKLSVAIITKNEEAVLGRTLAAARFADEIVVVDSVSTDATAAVADASGAKVFVEEWAGFAAQKNSALAKCSGDWVLSIDADEEISAELRKEILETIANAQFDAYFIPRRNLIFGRWIKHGGYWPDAKLRLVRRNAVESGAASFEPRAVHEDIKFSGATGNLRGHLIHRAYPTLTEYIEHMDRYSTLAGEMLSERGRVSNSRISFAWNVFANPVATFFYNYICRLGFLDGREGLLLHAYHSVYISWKYAKAWEANRIFRTQQCCQ